MIFLPEHIFRFFLVRVCARVRQTLEEIHRPKRYRNNNKDENNSPKTLNDKSIVSLTFFFFGTFIWVLPLFLLIMVLSVLTRELRPVFIAVMRFLKLNLKNFEKLSRPYNILFCIFSFISAFWWYMLSTFQWIYSFLRLQEFQRFPDLAVLLLSLFIFSHISLLAWHNFLCQILFLNSGCIFLLVVSRSLILFHFW